MIWTFTRNPKFPFKLARFETPIGPWSETVSNCRGPQDAGAARFLARDSASVDATDVVHWDKEKDQQILQHVNVDGAASTTENKDAS
jgi:hypothetical protein